MDKTNKKTLEEIIRVDHAGERGAIKIYDIVFMVPTAAYALIMFTTSIFFVLIVRKIN